MRGKGRVASVSIKNPRITPAHAGKSWHSNSSARRRWDHPRPCGEKLSSSCAMMHMPGSPPPMRGKGAAKPGANVFDRITPAHAGKSSAFNSADARGKDHPRPCGEKLEGTIEEAVKGGSPPPMRGKDAGGHYLMPARRITPAHAGKSRHPPDAILGVRDHPRPCGEKRRGRASEAQHRGSPPPMRGKVHIGIKSFLIVGITPAHAGKSYLFSQIFLFAKDHPRPCGEKSGKRCFSRLLPGSPPPMRGKVAAARQHPSAVGITPAHAGKSRYCACLLSASRDHPRPCGEKPSLQLSPNLQSGSPPPMRGKAFFHLF